MSEPEISLIVPFHNEEGNLGILYEETREVLRSLGVSYEMILVNDGSTDKTGDMLKRIKERDPNVRVIFHAKNYGQAASLSSGFLFARGRIVVTMDGDGQNDPRDIPLLLDALKKGYKAVSGWRVKRKEPFFSKILPSIIANRIIALITGVNVHDTGCSLKAYRGEVVKGSIVPHGFHRFFPAFFGLKDAEVTEVRVRDRKRLYGSSHYGLSRIKEVLRDAITFPFIFDERKWLLRMRFVLFISSAVSLFLILFLILERKGLLLFFLFFFLVLSFCSAVIYKNLQRIIFTKEKALFDRQEIT